MIFRLLSLRMMNFKSYYGKHVWVLPSEPGLYYITGQNRYNPRLGSNGIGKSTLTDAINWVLYGKTSRGLRASDVVAWGKSSCKATAMFQIGDNLLTDKYEISRSQNPNHILINDKSATQDEVDKLIRLNQAALNNSMLLPQFGDSFLDLSPSGKLVMFSRMMDLNYWLERSKVADSRADMLANTVVSFENKIAHAKGSIERLRSSILDLKASSAEFADSIKAEIKEQKEALAEMQDELEQQRERYANLERLMNKERQKRDEVKQLHEKAGQLLVTEEREVLELQVLLRSNERRHKELYGELLHIENLLEKTCPTCFQKVDKQHGKKHQLTVLEKIENLETEANGYKGQLKKAQKSIDVLKQKYNEHNTRYSNIEHNYNDLAGKLSGSRHSIDNIQHGIRGCGVAIENLRQKTNPFEALIAANVSERKALKLRIEKLNHKIAELKMQHEANVYWVKGFKRVRLFVIEEALAALEVEVNNLLITLGLVNWKITFDVERENKSGGVTKGFIVLIHSPRHKKPIRFESFSGGEVQRLRLAGDLGLSNLIMEQAGFENMVEIIDEPSEHLSTEGIEDLIGTIAERAEDTGRQIWLIDHVSMNSSLFAGTLQCIMSEKGHAKFRYVGRD